MSMVETLYRAACPLCDWRGAISSEYDRARANATLHRADQHDDDAEPLFEVESCWVPAGPVRKHLTSLRDQGATVRGIAAVAGVSPTTVSTVLRSRRQRRMQDTLATALLTVTIRDVGERRDRAGFVPKDASCRRIRALMAAGWRHADITTVMGTGTSSHLVLSQRGDLITRQTAAAVDHAWQTLRDRPGPSQVARERAARRGYAALPAIPEATILTPVTQGGITRWSTA